MTPRPSIPRSATRAWLLADSREIEDSLLPGFDDWHSELDDDRAEDPPPDEVP